MRTVKAHNRGFRTTKRELAKLALNSCRPSLKIAVVIPLLRCAGPDTPDVTATASRIEHVLANPYELPANRDLLAAVAERHRQSTKDAAIAALLRSMLGYELDKLDKIDFSAQTEAIDNLRRKSEFATSQAMVSFARKLDLEAIARRADDFLRASESLYLATLSALGLPIPIAYRDLRRASQTTAPAADSVDELGREATALLLERNSIDSPRAQLPRSSAKISRLRAFLRDRRLASELVFEARWLAQPSAASAKTQLAKIAKTLYLNSDSAALVEQRTAWGTVALRFRALEISHRLERALVDSHGETGWQETDVEEALDTLIVQRPDPGAGHATLGLTAIAKILTEE